MEDNNHHQMQSDSGYPLFTDVRVKGRDRFIDTSTEVWRIGDVKNRSINFYLIKLRNHFLLDQLKYCLSEWLKSWAPDTVSNHFNAIKNFLNSCSEISADSHGESLCVELEDEIIRYFIANRNQEDENRLSLIRAWYAKSEGLGLPAFNEHVVLYMNELSLKGNVKGLDVMIQIDGRGPLRTSEFFHLKDLLKKHQNHFNLGTAGYWKLVATWLFIVLGIRGEQLRLLLDTDFLSKLNSDGKKIYLLNVPSVKKHYSLPRTFFKKRSLPVFIGELIEGLIARNREWALERGLKFESLPVFMSSHGTQVEGGRDGAFEYMFSDSAIKNAPGLLLEEINRIEIDTEGVPLSINLTPRRLRKTFATQAAAQGIPARILAELLDHEDLQHVMVYYEQTVEFTHKLDAVYKEAFGDLFDFFKGETTLEAVVKAHKKQVVYGPASLRKLIEIGYCGSDQRCNLAPPYSCYGCTKLHACDNKSVHQEVLKCMMDEVDDLFKRNVSPGKYDSEHILACAQLISQLEVA